jgi:putative addiction module component (TIGR02574 family)
MSKNLSKLESEARRLPTKDRAKLIRRLIATLEADDDGDVEQLWLDEAEKRLASYRRGETSAHPGEEVFEAILNRA